MNALTTFVVATLCGRVWSAPLTLGNQRAPKCIYTAESEPRNNPSILIPLYSSGSIDNWGNCNDPMFLSTAKGCRSTVAILNPNTGPKLDDQQANAFRICAQLLEENNVKMVGYVYTKLTLENPKTGEWSVVGMRPRWEVENDLEIWARLMEGFDLFQGIFLDNVSTFYEIEANLYNIDQVKWYRELITASKKKVPGMVILNPGEITSLDLVIADPENGFPEPADVVVDVEESSVKWNPPDNNCFPYLWTSRYGTFGPGPWCFYVPIHDGANPFIDMTREGKIGAAALVHGADQEFAFTQGAIAFKNGFKYFYASNVDLVDNPWQTIPNYWETYLSGLDFA